MRLSVGVLIVLAALGLAAPLKNENVEDISVNGFRNNLRTTRNGRTDGVNFLRPYIKDTKTKLMIGGLPSIGFHKDRAAGIPSSPSQAPMGDQSQRSPIPAKREPGQNEGGVAKDPNQSNEPSQACAYKNCVQYLGTVSLLL